MEIKRKFMFQLMIFLQKAMGNRNSLIFKWVSFFGALLNPIVFISLFSALIFIYLSIIYKYDPTISIFTGLAGSFLAAVFGAFFKGGYAKLTEESVLEKKGESAVRNIKSIEGQINRVQSLIDLFTNPKKHKNKLSDVELKEINRHLMTMSINVQSGIEDWTDIVPALKEKKAKEKELFFGVKPLLEELSKKRLEFFRVKDKKAKKSLEKKIEELENQIERQSIEKRGIFLSTEPVNPTFSRGITPLTHSYLGQNEATSISLETFNKQSCRRCGKEIKLGNFGISGSLYNGLCSDCIMLPPTTLNFD